MAEALPVAGDSGKRKGPTSNLWHVLLFISNSPLYTSSIGSVQFNVFLSTCTGRQLQRSGDSMNVSLHLALHISLLHHVRAEAAVSVESARVIMCLVSHHHHDTRHCCRGRGGEGCTEMLA